MAIAEKTFAPTGGALFVVREAAPLQEVSRGIPGFTECFAPKEQEALAASGALLTTALRVGLTKLIFERAAIVKRAPTAAQTGALAVFYAGERPDERSVRGVLFIDDITRHGYNDEQIAAFGAVAQGAQARGEVYGALADTDYYTDEVLRSRPFTVDAEALQKVSHLPTQRMASGE